MRSGRSRRRVRRRRISFRSLWGSRTDTTTVSGDRVVVARRAIMLALLLLLFLFLLFLLLILLIPFLLLIVAVIRGITTGRARRRGRRLSSPTAPRILLSVSTGRRGATRTPRAGRSAEGINRRWHRYSASRHNSGHSNWRPNVIRRATVCDPPDIHIRWRDRIAPTLLQHPDFLKELTLAKGFIKLLSLI